MLDPENIRYILLAIKQGKSMTVAQIRKWLCNEASYKIEDAADILLKAVLDGILIPSSSEILEKIRKTNALRDNVILSLVDIDSLPENFLEKDPYCYECHKPGVLENCRNCSRTFHVHCQRKDIFLPNGTNNIKLKDHVPIETFLSDETSDLNSSSNRDLDEVNRSITSTDDGITDELSPPHETSSSKLKEETFENEKTDEKNIDVLYVGQIREPKRKRANNSNQNYKNEVACVDDENNDINKDDESLCTNCRFLKKSPTLDPANITNEETCYLLQFVFTRIASWIPLETFSTLPKIKSFHPPGKEEINFYKAYCFKYIKTLDEIDEKIKNKEYKSFTEFYVDFLDIQHCIGIVFGTVSEEYLATEYQMKDCNYELSEIRQCRDCYRRSNDKNYINDWFCIPCVPRHELVYAKKTPWPYWPAKVIKFKDNKYDVRFFSDKHERAIIDAKYIKPIDEYQPTKTSSALRKAMEELDKYRIYDQQPAGTFSFEKERVFNRTITPLNLQNKNTDFKTRLRNRKDNLKTVPILTASNIVTKSNKKNITDTDKPSGSNSVSRRKQIDRKTKSNDFNTKNMKYYEAVKNLGKQIEKITNKDELKRTVMETMQNEMKLLNDQIKELSAEIIETKKKPWCKWCLQPATLYCCHNTSYCTLECQKLDWHNGHKFKCSHKNDAR
ncbi:zinc finger MYND domain-containing protein 11 [Condylostylus longicornis]|uniref:zinc finger MYND domain-containing protein 11 n=1 Tax=Condylostylus longicornis TaxID=2530218 RepID=UPI00244E230B|nr:zinc finger MYND domain-containing protein 11 [Condylostylus longicornis]